MEEKIIEKDHAPGILGGKDGIEQASRPAEETVVTRDGFRVHPQPTSDPLDPLNWSSFRKHSILAIVMFMYFMFTYITTTT